MNPDIWRRLSGVIKKEINNGTDPDSISDIVKHEVESIIKPYIDEVNTVLNECKKTEKSCENQLTSCVQKLESCTGIESACKTLESSCETYAKKAETYVANAAKDFQAEIQTYVLQALEKILEPASEQVFRLGVNVAQEFPDTDWSQTIGDFGMNYNSTKQELSKLLHWADNFPSTKTELLAMVKDLAPDGYTLGFSVTAPIVNEGATTQITLTKDEMITAINRYL